jgi:hypothetical protein
MNKEAHGERGLWGERPTPVDGDVLRVEVGPLTVWLKSVDNEIWLASARAAGKGRSPADGPPDDLEWSRWALRDEPHHLRILPALPNRALVVKPDHPFTLTRRARARIYVRVPTWVRVEVQERARGRPILLAEIPTAPLSDTWWGDFRDGELAYWLSTKARRAFTPDLFTDDQIMTVLQLDNISDDDLVVEKLLVRVEHLSVYQQETRLWAEEVRVEYRGETEGSDILMDDKPPKEAEGAREITPARTQSRSFRARTFARLRALTVFGL